MGKKTRENKGWAGDKKKHSEAARLGWQRRYEKLGPLTDQEIDAVQAKRSQRTKEMDAAFTSKRTFNRDDPRARPWLKHPGRFDIRDVDTRMIRAAGFELTGEETEQELKALIKKAATILKTRRPARKRTTVPVILETCESFDSRKHGHAYVALLHYVPGKGITREFINGENRVWSSSRKYYSQRFRFQAREGDVFEARLDDGSWKNDSRDYITIDGGDVKKISQREAFSLVQK